MGRSGDPHGPPPLGCGARRRARRRDGGCSHPSSENCAGKSRSQPTQPRAAQPMRTGLSLLADHGRPVGAGLDGVGTGSAGLGWDAGAAAVGTGSAGLVWDAGAGAGVATGTGGVAWEAGAGAGVATGTGVAGAAPGGTGVDSALVDSAAPPMAG